MEKLKRFEQGRFFQVAVALIIMVSALSAGISTYDLPPYALRTLEFLDMGVTLIFLLELSLRFAACDNKKRFLADGWNLFDTVIIFGSLIPLQDADSVVLGRLLRLFRVLRLVSSMRVLVNALFRSIMRTGHIVTLMFIIFYFYGTLGSLFFADIDDFLWGDVSISMLTLFRVATFEDWTDIMYATMEVHPLSWLFYLSFIFLIAFVFLNMIVGAILQVMGKEYSEESGEEKQLASIQSQLAQLNEKIAQIAREK